MFYIRKVKNSPNRLFHSLLIRAFYQNLQAFVFCDCDLKDIEFPF